MNIQPLKAWLLRLRGQIVDDVSSGYDPFVLDRHEKFARFAWSFGTIAVITVYMGGGLLRYGDPVGLFVAALCAGGMLSTFHVGMLMRYAWLLIIPGLFFVLFSLGFFQVAPSLLPSMARASRANDKRCLALQRDMLSEHPLRSDDPDLFQALGCRPQGEGSVYAPASESMIAVHHWLPWGGLP